MLLFNLSADPQTGNYDHPNKAINGSYIDFMSKQPVDFDVENPIQLDAWSYRILLKEDMD